MMRLFKGLRVDTTHKVSGKYVSGRVFNDHAWLSSIANGRGLAVHGEAVAFDIKALMGVRDEIDELISFMRHNGEATDA